MMTVVAYCINKFKKKHLMAILSMVQISLVVPGGKIVLDAFHDSGRWIYGALNIKVLYNVDILLLKYYTDICPTHSSRWNRGLYFTPMSMNQYIALGRYRIESSILPYTHTRPVLVYLLSCIVSFISFTIHT